MRIDLNPYIDRLKQPGYAVQFLKEGATNKTTHLLAIRRHFPDAPYIRLYEGEPAPPFPHYPILFIDWFHALSRRERVELLGRHTSFAIVSHVNHGREFKRVGLEYDLIKLPLYTVEQMAELVKRRIEWVRREPDKPVPTVSKKTIAGLLIKYGDDVAVNAHLYEVFEQLTGIHHV